MDFLLSFVISLSAIFLILRQARAYAAGDRYFNAPQKFHANPVPRFGGVAILLGIAVVYFVPQLLVDATMGRLLLACCLPAFVAGLVEDLTHRVSPSSRFLATAVSVLLGFWFMGAGLLLTGVPGLDWIASYTAGSVLMTVIFATGVTHAFNIIDGFNGLAAMCAMLILLSIACVAYQVGDATVMRLAFAVVGATLGFFVWNFPAGRIFLGDCGAYLLGFITATMIILLLKRNPQVSPLFGLLVVIYPVFETVFSMYRRKMLRSKPVSMADGIHLHSLVYRRVTRCLGGQTGRGLVRTNSMTSVWLWGLCAASLLPAMVLWDNTPLLLVCAMAFGVTYCIIYWRIVRFQTPRWMTSGTRFARTVFQQK